MTVIRLQFIAAVANRLGEEKILAASRQAAHTYAERSDDKPVISQTRADFNDLCILFTLRAPPTRKSWIEDLATELQGYLGGDISVRFDLYRLKAFRDLPKSQTPYAWLRHKDL